MMLVGVDDMNNIRENTISIIELTQRSYDAYKQALHFVKLGKQKESQYYFQQGDKLLLQMSQIHTQMLSQNVEVNLLMVHIEDLLISVQLYKSMIKELLVFYTKFPTLKGN